MASRGDRTDRSCRAEPRTWLIHMGRGCRRRYTSGVALPDSSSIRWSCSGSTELISGHSLGHELLLTHACGARSGAYRSGDAPGRLVCGRQRPNYGSERFIALQSQVYTPIPVHDPRASLHWCPPTAYARFQSVLRPVIGITYQIEIVPSERWAEAGPGLPAVPRWIACKVIRYTTFRDEDESRHHPACS